MTSSPEYPQSNGKAEKAVQIVNRLLKKAKWNDEDPYMALLNYRTSPLSGSDRSPGEVSMNRKLRTKLPSAEEHVTMHKLPDIKQKRYYDHSSNQLEPRHLLKTQEKFMPEHDDDGDGDGDGDADADADADDDDDDKENAVCVDHPSGGATASTDQSAVTPEAAQSGHSTIQSQPVSTKGDVRTTRSGRIIKLPSRYVHD